MNQIWYPRVSTVCDSIFSMFVSASVSAFSKLVMSTFGWTGVCIKTEYSCLSKFIRTIPDRIPTADRIKTKKSGQTDTWQKIRTEPGQQTDTGHDFPENADKNETRTGHGQCCPPTSVIQVTLRRSNLRWWSSDGPSYEDKNETPQQFLSLFESSVTTQCDVSELCDPGAVLSINSPNDSNDL